VVASQEGRRSNSVLLAEVSSDAATPGRAFFGTREEEKEEEDDETEKEVLRSLQDVRRLIVTSAAGAEDEGLASKPDRLPGRPPRPDGAIRLESSGGLADPWEDGSSPMPSTSIATTTAHHPSSHFHFPHLPIHREPWNQTGISKIISHVLPRNVHINISDTVAHERQTEENIKVYLKQSHAGAIIMFFFLGLAALSWSCCLVCCVLSAGSPIWGDCMPEKPSGHFDFLDSVKDVVEEGGEAHHPLLECLECTCCVCCARVCWRTFGAFGCSIWCSVLGISSLALIVATESGVLNAVMGEIVMYAFMVWAVLIVASIVFAIVYEAASAVSAEFKRKVMPKVYMVIQFFKKIDAKLDPLATFHKDGNTETDITTSGDVRRGRTRAGGGAI
jgi:hypothetical protein